MSNLEPIMEKNFIEYASYVILDRAIPDIRDGCKPVQRRILNTLHKVNDGKFHKVANIIGETMKLHPHGDASIGAALVVLANKEYFIEKQGNYGNILTGHRAAAPRYIECRLTPLALETMFHKALTEFVPSYDGRSFDPVSLPAKLPVLLMLGTEGIAVGMATRIFPHNLPELLQAQIAILHDQYTPLIPDFPGGGIVDASDYDDGRGKVRVRAKMDTPNDKKIVIHEVPYSTTTESLIASIETAAQKGKIKISSIDDFTAEHVEIEITLPRGVSSAEVLPQLYAYSDCEVSLTSSIITIHNNGPRTLSIHEALQCITKDLSRMLQAELEYDRDKLLDKQHALTLEQIFIENRIYKQIENATTENEVAKRVTHGMAPFSELFVRELTEDDVERLLKLPIRRISAYDISKSRKDIDDIVKEIRAIKRQLRNMRATTIGYLEGILKRYGERYPRKTTLATFGSVDKRSVALQSLKVTYDRASGFFGTEVKNGESSFKLSEYDRILLINKKGNYQIIGPVDKLLVGDLIHCAPFNPDVGAFFTVIYRNKDKIAFGKKIHILKFTRGREYSVFKDEDCQLDLLLSPDTTGAVELKFKPSPRQRQKKSIVELDSLKLISPSARGPRMASKPVSKIRIVKSGTPDPNTSPDTTIDTIEPGEQVPLLKL